MVTMNKQNKIKSKIKLILVKVLAVFLITPLLFYFSFYFINKLLVFNNLYLGVLQFMGIFTIIFVNLIYLFSLYLLLSIDNKTQTSLREGEQVNKQETQNDINN